HGERSRAVPTPGGPDAPALRPAPPVRSEIPLNRCPPFGNAHRVSNETERDTSLVLRRHGRLAPPVEGDVLVSADLGPQGTMVALWARPEDREALFGRTRGSGGASFPDPRTARPVEVRVAEYAPRMQRVV